MVMIIKKIIQIIYLSFTYQSKFLDWDDHLI